MAVEIRRLAAAPLPFRRYSTPSPWRVSSPSTSTIPRRFVALAAVKKSPKRLKYSTPRFTKVFNLFSDQFVNEIAIIALPYLIPASGGWIVVRRSWSVRIGLVEIGLDRWATQGRSRWSYPYRYCVCQFLTAWTQCWILIVLILRKSWWKNIVYDHLMLMMNHINCIFFVKLCK